MLGIVPDAGNTAVNKVDQSLHPGAYIPNNKQRNTGKIDKGGRGVESEAGSRKAYF